MLHQIQMAFLSQDDTVAQNIGLYNMLFLVARSTLIIFVLLFDLSSACTLNLINSLSYNMRVML
jgi:hypothetical protein